MNADKRRSPRISFQHQSQIHQGDGQNGFVVLGTLWSLPTLSCVHQSLQTVVSAQRTVTRVRPFDSLTGHGRLASLQSIRPTSRQAKGERMANMGAARNSVEEGPPLVMSQTRPKSGPEKSENRSEKRKECGKCEVSELTNPWAATDVALYVSIAAPKISCAIG